MSDNKAVTEREAVLREREAFARGAHWAWFTNYAESSGAKFNHEGYVDQRVADRYPLPTITRLREVPDPHKATTVWRCAERTLQFRFEGMAWQDAHTTQSTHRTHIDWPTPKRIALWSDLLQNPLEEVTE